MFSQIRRLVPAALALAALLTLLPQARADVIDVELLKKAPEIMETLVQQKYKNVGVLKFEVQRGGADGPISMQVGRLNSRMATRLENILILVNDEQTPLGIARSAGDVAAARDRSATYRTPEGRQRLLAGTYPCAWGEEQLPLDAFLTGLVRLAPDLKEATVILKVFDRAGAAEPPRDLLRLTIPITLSLLSDMDMSFYVRRRGSDDDPLGIPELVKDATENIRQVQQAKQPQGVEKQVERVLDFRIFYDGKEITRKQDGTIETPRLNQEVQFRLKNKGLERLGVVVRVNGVNTVDNDREDKDPPLYVRWILEPGREYALRGFYSKNKFVQPFKALPEEKLQENPELFVISKIGKIEIDVFREGALKDRWKDLARTQYNLSEPSKPAASLALLQGQIRTTQTRQLNTQIVTGRSLIGPGETQKTALEAVPFQGYHVGHVSISYLTSAPQTGKNEKRGPTEPGVGTPK
jgi:hypothetical protein